MFAGINIYLCFWGKTMFAGLIFAVSSGLVSYLDTWIMFAWHLFLRFTDGSEIRQLNLSQTLTRKTAGTAENPARQQTTTCDTHIYVKYY